jgi:hypothetical protein
MWFGMLFDILFEKLFGERDSKPIASGNTRGTREVYVSVLDDLASRKNDSFATFEAAARPGLWFKVNGSELVQGNCPWPGTDEQVGVMLGRLGIAVPEDFQIVADDPYEGTRVITFECAPMPPPEWANLIDAFFARVYGLAPDYQVKGWVTRAD